MTVFPSWPEMRVIGESVTREQAREILTRNISPIFFDETDGDEEWSRIIREAYNLAPQGLQFIGTEDEHFFEDNQEWNAHRLEQLGVLTQVRYVHNHQIASGFLMGPHGWVDWDGHIDGTSRYQVGANPTSEGLLQDWAAIAEAFPFLKLKAQFSSEYDMYDGQDLILEIEVKDGTAGISQNPKEFPYLGHHLNDNLISAAYAMMKPGAERGIDREYLRESIALLEKKFGVSLKDSMKFRSI